MGAVVPMHIAHYRAISDLAQKKYVDPISELVILAKLLLSCNGNSGLELTLSTPPPSIPCCILRTSLLFPSSLQRQEGLVVVWFLHQLAQPVAPSVLYTCFQSNMTLKHAGAKSSNGGEAAHCTKRNEHTSSEGYIYT